MRFYKFFYFMLLFVVSINLTEGAEAPDLPAATAARQASRHTLAVAWAGSEAELKIELPKRPTFVFHYSKENKAAIKRILSSMPGFASDKLDLPVVIVDLIIAYIPGVWLGVVHTYSNEVSFVDCDAASVIRTIRVGASPVHAMAFKRKIYIANQYSGDLTVVNADTFESVATIEVGRLPRAITEREGKLHVEGADGKAVVDPETDQALIPGEDRAVGAVDIEDVNSCPEVPALARYVMP